MSKFNRKEAILYLEALTKAILQYKRRYADEMVRAMNRERKSQRYVDFDLGDDKFHYRITIYEK